MYKPHIEPTEGELRYGVDENPPSGLSWMLAAQTVTLIIAGIVLTPAIVLRAAGLPASLEEGVIFFALLVCGITTMVQARKVWHFGAGYILLMGTSGAFIAVAITALQLGGMKLLMTLIVISSLIEFLLAHRLVLLRRIITPLVGGTTIMLLAVTVMPYAFMQFPPLGEGEAAYQDPLVAFVSLATILGFSFFGSPKLRLWAPVIGIVAGTVLSAYFGDLDLARVKEAQWIGVPELTVPGFDLSFGQHFWVLLPAFVIVTIVGAIETFGDAIAIQHMSNRDERPVDYRTVQGALNADGLGNLLSGLLGTLPNTTYSTSISVVDLTGVAARKVGFFCGVLILVLAFFPKVSAAILSIPTPVVGAYILVLILLLFMHGVRMVARDGLSYEKGFVVGMGFWLGMGFQHKAIFADRIPDWLAPILGNGMTSGTLVTLILVALLGLRRSHRKSVETHLTEAAMPQVEDLIGQAWSKNPNWPASAVEKLQLAGKEVLLALMEMRDRASETPTDKLHMEIVTSGETVELSVGVAPLHDDIKDLIDASQSSKPMGMSKLPFQILGELVEDLQHYRYFGLDYISMTIRCDDSGPRADAETSGA
jgi:NCS2 family nucleobase:cation symporter-2/xanthine permease XanP